MNYINKFELYEIKIPESSALQHGFDYTCAYKTWYVEMTGLLVH